MRWGPHKFLGVWFSFKLDRTIRQHAFYTLLTCPVHPLIPLLFYFSKEIREGLGYDFKVLSEDCVGWGKCLQGFGLGDFFAVLAVAVPYWLLNLFTVINITWSFS